MNKKLKIALLFFLVLILLGSAVTADNNDLFLDGLNHYYQEDYENAINTFEDHLEENNSDIDTLYYQTLAYLKTANISMVKQNMQLLEDLGYTYAVHHWRLGELYLNKRGIFDSPYYNEAKRELEKANKLGISSASLHSDLAMAFQGLGNKKKAAEHYEIAVEKGAVVDDYFNLASLYKETGKSKSALELYKKILEEDQERRSVYLNMGNIYLDEENYQEAIDILNKGLEIDNSSVAIRTSLAEAYYKNEDYQQAKEHYQKVIEQNPNIYQAYFYLAEIYNLVEDNYEQGVNYYQKAINYNKNYVKAYLSLGNLYLENDEYYSAMAQFINAIESNSEHAEAHYRLGLAFYEMGRIESAIEELRITLHLDNDHNKARLLLNRLRDEE